MGVLEKAYSSNIKAQMILFAQGQQRLNSVSCVLAWPTTCLQHAPVGLAQVLLACATSTPQAVMACRKCLQRDSAQDMCVCAGLDQHL